jgi:hypothetical protein
MNLMKSIGLFLLALVAVSCWKMDDNGNYIMTTGRVEIIQTDIPETATVNQFAEIKAIAEESNNCWSNLYFELTENSDFDYTLEAFGLYQSYGSCAAVKVTGDTTIAFKPTQTGIYKFHIVKSEKETALDSMIVVNEIK